MHRHRTPQQKCTRSITLRVFLGLLITIGRTHLLSRTTYRLRCWQVTGPRTINNIELKHWLFFRYPFIGLDPGIFRFLRSFLAQFASYLLYSHHVVCDSAKTLYSYNAFNGTIPSLHTLITSSQGDTCAERHHHRESAFLVLSSQPMEWSIKDRFVNKYRQPCREPELI